MLVAFFAADIGLVYLNLADKGIDRLFKVRPHFPQPAQHELSRLLRDAYLTGQLGGGIALAV